MWGEFLMFYLLPINWVKCACVSFCLWGVYLKFDWSMAYFDKKTLFCLKPPVSNPAMGKKKETANPQVQEVNQPAASTLHTLEWLNQIPSAKVDHVERAQLLTELISKERKAMHKLSHLNLAINDTNDQSQLDPQFSINPYNKSMIHTAQ